MRGLNRCITTQQDHRLLEHADLSDARPMLATNGGRCVVMFGLVPTGVCGLLRDEASDGCTERRVGGAGECDADGGARVSREQDIKEVVKTPHFLYECRAI